MGSTFWWGEGFRFRYNGDYLAVLTGFRLGLYPSSVLGCWCEDLDGLRGSISSARRNAGIDINIGERGTVSSGVLYLSVPRPSAPVSVSVSVSRICSLATDTSLLLLDL